MYVLVNISVYVSVLAHLVHCCCHRSVKRVPRWKAPVCRLSVWRWRHHGLSRKLGSEFEKRESERGIHPSIRASSHIPPSKPQTRSRESRKGEKGEEGKVERERKRKRGRPYEHAGNVRVTSVRVYRHCEGPWPAYILLARPRAPLPISPASRQSPMPL